VLISSLRIRASSLTKVDAIASERDWTRSEALRYLLGLGLAEHERQHGPPRTVTGRAPRPEPRAATSAHGPAVIDAATHAKLQKKGHA
jgi:hypothetical protein